MTSANEEVSSLFGFAEVILLSCVLDKTCNFFRAFRDLILVEVFVLCSWACVFTKKTFFVLFYLRQRN